MSHHIGNMTPHAHRAWKSVANVLAGGAIHPMFPHISPAHFKDYRYSKHYKVPRQAYLDVARSSRETLMNALEDESNDYGSGATGAGLWHAVNSTANAAAHWARK